jgi:hypothetical protein
MTPTNIRAIITRPSSQRLPQHLQDVAAELRPFIQEEHPVLGSRHLAGQRHLAPADQSDSRDRVVRGATGARGDDGGAGAGHLDGRKAHRLGDFDRHGVQNTGATTIGPVCQSCRRWIVVFIEMCLLHPGDSHVPAANHAGACGATDESLRPSPGAAAQYPSAQSTTLVRGRSSR